MAKLTYNGPVLGKAKDANGKTVANFRVNRHERYNGYDPETGEFVTAGIGETIEVSDAKAAQLLKDFPKAWEKAGGRGA